MLKKIMFLAAALFVLIVFAAGCSSNTAANEDGSKSADGDAEASVSGDTEEKGNPDSSGETIIEPGSLFSKAEVENLFGVAFKDATITEQEAVGLKIYAYVSEDGSQFFQISLTQEAFMRKEVLEAGQTPKAIFDAILDNTEDPEMVDNIGDKAFIGTPGIHILSGNYYITIALGDSDDAENIEKLKEAAMIAVVNLEKLN